MIFDIPPINNPVITGLVEKKPDEAPGVFGKFIGSIVGVLLLAGSIWAFFQLLLGGLQWISSSGDKAALEKAQKRITNALIGLLIVFAFWAVYLVILQYLGIIGPGGEIKFILPTL